MSALKRLVDSRVLAAFLIMILTSATAFAQTKPFALEEIGRDADRYEAYLRDTYKPDGRPAKVWIKQAQKQLFETNPTGAAESFSTAILIEPDNAETWLALANALRTITPVDDNARYTLVTNASGAAYRAYRLATKKDTEAAALAVLASNLKDRAYWRPAINAYKASLDVVEVASIRADYEQLLAEQGFRVLDYAIDSDSATPRLCIQLSELLRRGGEDFAKFVRVNGTDPTAVTAAGSELCVEGLKHGQRYEVSVKAGLPSDVDETLHKSAELSIYVRDRSPQVRFTGRNYVLPNRGQQGIPVVSVNTKKVKSEIYRIGDRGLVRSVTDGDIESQFSQDRIEDLKSRSGTPVFAGEMDVKQSLNEEVTTAFDISAAVGTLTPGVYVMIATAEGQKSEYWDSRATQWFVISDLGLAALSGDDGVHAFVRSLADTTPTAGVTVKLIARNNEVLGTASTDARGYARFAAGLARGEGGNAPAVLIAESTAGDYAFLDLATGAFDLSDRGVAGRPAPGPLDAYVWAERGVYRPGEPVHVGAILRDRKGLAATAVPLTLVVARPDGVEHLSAGMPDQGIGGRATRVDLSAGAMAGTWRLRVHTDPKAPPIGETSFLVEDYVPERMDLTLEPAQAAFSAGSSNTIKATGRYLYGPAAIDLAVEGEIIVGKSSAGLPGFPGYFFGLAGEEVTPVRTALTGLPKTDAEGIASVPIALPALPQTSRLLEAKVVLRLREEGGRTIERSLVAPILPARTSIGLKPLFDSGLGRGEKAGFDVVAISPKAVSVAANGLKWELLRIERSYQWYGRNGSWNYEPIVYTKRIADGTLDLDPQAPGRISVAVDWGSYRLEVASSEPGGPVASYEFDAGWYAGKSADSPEVLDIGLDKESYAEGDTARLRIVTEAAGRAVVAVLREGLVSVQEVAVPAGGSTVDVAIDPSFAPGAYVAAMLYRPMDVAGKRMPSRAIGITWLPLASKSRTLEVSLGAPAKVASGATLDVPITIAGLSPGEEARVTVAAVDVGILNLTGYDAPAPEAWYFGQRQLGVEVRDLYGRLIDGMRAERGTVRSGGDGGALEALGSPPTQEPVALFSGLIAVGADGTASASFTLPEFNGSVRLMAVAWSASKLGHAEKDVIVRDPVALLVSGPRFLTLGDNARLVFDMHNVEAPAGDYALTMSVLSDDLPSPLVSERTVKLGAGERKLEVIPIKADRLGRTSYTLALEGPGGVDLARAFELEVGAPSGEVKRTTVQALSAKTGKLTVSSDVLTGLIAERSSVTVTVGPAAGFDVPGLLAALDRYPYGCAEQITSRALPLLYLNTVAAASGVTGEAAAKERVEAAIGRLFEMQDSSGAFGLWGPGTADLWLSAYVTDFLTRAKEQGYAVPARQLGEALDRLQNSVAFAADFEKGGEEIAYALYVLARNSRAPIGDLRYYADTRIERFSTPLAKAQIGAALAMYGDSERAERVFKLAVTDYSDGGEDAYRADYGSALRDGAAILTLVSETKSVPASAAPLTSLVTAARVKRSATSTQEQAWLLLAARALIEEGKGVSLTVNGSATTGNLSKRLTAADLAAGPLTVANTGDRELQAVVTVTGESTEPEPATANGFSIERTYYKLDGTALEDIGAAGSLMQNDRVVVVLHVVATDALGGRVLLVDRLPAGLEIENPRLVAGGSVAGLPWLTETTAAEHTEFRDDRFVAAFDLGSTAPASGEDIENPSITVAYIARAVSQGAFVHPAATIEDMYRPERQARSAAGKLEVKAAAN